MLKISPWAYFPSSQPIIHLPPVRPSTGADVWAAPVSRTALGLHDRACQLAKSDADGVDPLGQHTARSWANLSR
jgi:hypothetical protein